MAVRSHRDLRAWQHADEVRRNIIALCAVDVVRRDFAFCDQAQRAAASACRNLAEGFARYHHADFARFVTVAYASLAELEDSIDEAHIKAYIDDEQRTTLVHTIEQAKRSAAGLRTYLRRTPTPK